MNARTLFILAGVLVLAFVLGRLFTVQESLREQRRRETHGPARVLRLTSAAMEHIEGGKLRSQVWARRAVYDEDGRNTELEVVRFRAFPEDTEQGPQLPVDGTSERALMEEDAARLVLIGDVRIRQGPDLRLTGERLIYHYGEGLLVSPEPVRVEDGNAIYEGSALEYTLTDRRLRLERPRVVQ